MWAMCTVRWYLWPNHYATRSNEKSIDRTFNFHHHFYEADIWQPLAAAIFLGCHRNSFGLTFLRAALYNMWFLRHPCQRGSTTGTWKPMALSHVKPTRNIWTVAITWTNVFAEMKYYSFSLRKTSQYKKWIFAPSTQQLYLPHNVDFVTLSKCTFVYVGIFRLEHHRQKSKNWITYVLLVSVRMIFSSECVRRLPQQ